MPLLPKIKYKNIMRNFSIEIILIIMLGTLSFKSYCQDNYIIAGNTEGVLYTDIQDTLISTIFMLGEKLYEIDINMDNEMDFVISAYYAAGISHEYAHISIRPYGNNKVAFSDSVPATYGQDTIFFENKAKGVNTNDTINSNIQFINDKVYLRNESYLVISFSIYINWGDWEYIPVCLESEDDESCMYGWIKVSGVTWREINIESFAVEIQNNSLMDQMIKGGITVYPNPSNDYINIDYPGKDVTIEIYNVNGQKQNVQINSTDETSIISISHLPNGIYLLKQVSENKSSVVKFIKK